MSKVQGPEAHGKISNLYAIWIDGRKHLATPNLAPGKKVYDERIVNAGGTEYRLWNPWRSKLCAAVLKGINFPLESDSRILYLGAATGTTVSHISDMVPDGIIYAVEISPRPVSNLIETARSRKNVIPILADAARPSTYLGMVETVDFIYQDIAQRDQAGIALKNGRTYLRKGGTLVLALKSQSIDSAAKPGRVFEGEAEKLSEEFRIRNRVRLEPHHKYHMMLTADYV